MKKLLFLLLLMPLYAFAQLPSVVSMEFTFMEPKVEKAIDPAQRQAISQVLFRGVHGTGCETPLLTTDEDYWFATFPQYFDQLFNERRGRYASFITGTSLVEKGKDSNGQKYVTLKVGVNISALLSDLENHGVKRRFGL
ncbi:MAG: hypothetical protein IJ808_02345 [Muribaculaceae bacterium]|nr:hypothetical protein [Muribaculaceae bacterium]